MKTFIIILLLAGLSLRTFGQDRPVKAASQAEVNAGVSTTKFISPATAAGRLTQPPQEIWVFAGDYGGANATNAWVNSAGSAVVLNTASGGGTPWAVSMSNQLKNTYGINLTRADTSISYPGITPDFVLAQSASSSMPPFDNNMPFVRWLKNQSPNYTGTNKVFIEWGSEATIINGAAGCEVTNFMVATNMVDLLEADGWNVYLIDWTGNNSFWVSYTNQTQAGINLSNYIGLVQNSGRKYIPYWQFSLPYITNSALNSDTNYYNPGGNHIGYFGLPGTNIANFFATNANFYTPKRYPALTANQIPTISYLGSASNFHVDGTNPSILFYTANNLVAPGGALTNNYVVANGTVSNIPPYTWVDWRFDCDIISSANDFRWIIKTDQTVSEWTANSSASSSWARQDGGSWPANSVVGPVTFISGGHAQVSYQGTFLTSSNITALQFWFAPAVTNAGNCSLKTGQGFHAVNYGKVPIPGY